MRRKHIFIPGVIIIVGPTAVGKSDFSQEFAIRCNGEIINGDLGQFYTPLSIGTAKPDLAETKVKHHLFNVLDEPINYTVYDYRSDVIKTINLLWSRKKIPIIAGGSTFYMSSLFFPPLTNHDMHTRTLSQAESEYLQKASWRDLYEIDPERAQEINKNDLYRIRRALKIWFLTNQKPSSVKPIFNPIASSLFIVLTRQAEELNRRIHERVLIMIKPWIEECRSLKGTRWEDFAREKGFIGYAEIFDYLESSQSHTDFKNLIATISTKTKQYAKKQMTFWRMLQNKLTTHSDLFLV